MKAIIIARPGAHHHPTWGGAFAAGLRRHGWQVRLQADVEECDLLVMWSARREDRARQQIASGGQVCILERGYLGDRFAWTSVSFGGGLNGRGEFRGPLADASRWNTHFAHLMKPWRDVPGGYALILQQVPGDKAIQGVDMEAFYRRAGAAFAHMPIKIRPHPRAHPKDGSPVMVAAQASLQADLAGAACAITYNSNSAVDAVLAGVPTVAMDRGSMAWDVTAHAFEDPPRPDRSAWASALAWKQWRLEEMESGYCWEVVGK